MANRKPFGLDAGPQVALVGDGMAQSRFPTVILILISAKAVWGQFPSSRRSNPSVTNRSVPSRHDVAYGKCRTHQNTLTIAIPAEAHRRSDDAMGGVKAAGGQTEVIQRFHERGERTESTVRISVVVEQAGRLVHEILTDEGLV